MPQAMRLELSEAQRAELVELRDHAPLPYLRERASAVLQVGDGASASHVAREGVLRPRYYETVVEWVKRYQAEGVAGLRIKAGRGRKPAFSPRRAG